MQGLKKAAVFESTKDLPLVMVKFCLQYLGRHDRTCLRARKGHSRPLQSADEQKIFVNKPPFLSRLALYTLKLLARISL